MREFNKILFTSGIALVVSAYFSLNHGTLHHPRNENPRYANPKKLEFKVEDLNSDKEKETILFDGEKKENYLVLRDEKGNINIRKYDLKIEYKEIYGESK